VFVTGKKWAKMFEVELVDTNGVDGNTRYKAMEDSPAQLASHCIPTVNIFHRFGR